MTVKKKNNIAKIFLVFSLGCFGLISNAVLGAVTTQEDTASGPAPSELESEANNVVVLRALDKITARITEIELEIGDEVRFGTLAIRAKYCRTRPPIEPPETFAYLEIDDLKRSGDIERVFEGWMVASSPALNALEHAVYDIWVINCKMVEPESP